ncbi:methyltransferase [Candidatus Woesearchaeota archaeon]|nr:methyltransferase [Candidatus Woesearchaeota archaeon]
MKAIVLTNKGIEDISAKEIKELINKKAEKKDGFLIFEAEQKEIIQICYLARSITKVILLVEDAQEWTKGKTFAIRGKTEYAEKHQIKGKTDLKNPDTEFYAVNEQYCGIDLTGEDLAKRDYRIFLGSESIKGNIAYALVRLSGYSSDKRIIDPYCRDGIIPIEAALYALNISPHYYKKDKFNFLKLFDVNLAEFDSIHRIKTEINAIDIKITSVNAAKKNAKIAGVNKNINFAKIQTEDLELKFQENSVDCIATMMPYLGKLSETKIKEIYREFFYNAEFILGKKGKLVLLTRPQRKEVLEQKAKENKLKLKEERTISIGKEEWKILTFICVS